MVRMSKDTTAIFFKQLRFFLFYDDGKCLTKDSISFKIKDSKKFITASFFSSDKFSNNSKKILLLLNFGLHFNLFYIIPLD